MYDESNWTKNFCPNPDLDRLTSSNKLIQFTQFGRARIRLLRFESHGKLAWLFSVPDEQCKQPGLQAKHTLIVLSQPCSSILFYVFILSF